MDELSPSTPAVPPAKVAESDPHEKPRVALAAGLAVLWGVFVLLAQLSGALDTFEEPLLDWRISLHAYPSPPSKDLALIAIDNVPPDHPWPWSRLDYSLVLRSLIDYAPQSVVFDMNLNDRDTEYTSFDDTFSHIVQRANTVVFASTVLIGSSADKPPGKLVSIPFTGSIRQVSRFESAIWPLDTFAGRSPVGVNNVQSESGMRLRRLPLVFMLDGKMAPSLVLQASAQYLGADLASSQVQVGSAILLRSKNGKLLRKVPIDDQGRMRIRYHQGAGTSWQASFDNILLYDDQTQHGITADHNMRDISKRQVWIGRTDADAHERFQTPVGALSRVEAQIAAERTILDQDFIRPLPPMILAVLYLLIGIGGAIGVIRFGPVHAAAILVIFAAFWLESSALVFRVYNVILPLPSLALLLFGAYAVGVLASYWDLAPDEEASEKNPAVK